MVNEEFINYIVTYHLKLFEEITDYFSKTYGVFNVPLYLATEFVSKYSDVERLKYEFSLLKEGNKSDILDDLKENHTKEYNYNKHEPIYKSIYKGYICCPECGNKYVPLTSHICTVCSCGLGD